MTYNELLYDAIKCDEEQIAYRIYFLIRNQLVQGHERYNVDKALEVSQEELTQLIQENPLNLNKIKLYSMPINAKEHFIVLAESEESARGHCMNELNIIPKKIIDISNKLDTDFWFEDSKQYKSLRAIKDETLIFPATVMIFEKEQN